MKIQILAILIVMFFSGCELFQKSCDDYCSGMILHECTNNGGLFGGTDDWETTDCEEYNQVCVEKGNYANCVTSLDNCDSRISICIDGEVKDCHETDGEFFVTDGETCDYIFDYQICVDFENDARCVTPVDNCDSEAVRVCMENKTAYCYEKDGEFYIKYDADCKASECVEVEKYKAFCLTPVETCRPSEGSICHNNQVANCYEKDGRFFVSYIDLDCRYYNNGVCVELNNEKAKCLASIDSCDSTAESVCVDDAIAKCYEKDGLFYVDIDYYCHNGPEDNCVFDSSAKRAECLVP